MTELIGWFAAIVLLSTIGRQVYTQWRDGISKGLSRWLFIGQMTASIAFIIYSWLLGNWVFVDHQRFDARYCGIRPMDLSRK